MKIRKYEKLGRTSKLENWNIVDTRARTLTDVFALVESFRDLSREDGVHGANDDQHDGISESDHVTCVYVTVANQQIVLPGRIMMHRLGRVDYHPNSVDQNLHEHQTGTYDQLRPWRYEGWPLGAVLARVEDPRYSIRLR